MPKFNLYYGIEQEQYNLHSVMGAEFASVLEAKKEARAYAEDLYMQNPVRDIIDIEKEEGVDEDIARIQFNLDMIKKTIYHVDEIVEINGEVIEIIKHEDKVRRD